MKNSPSSCVSRARRIWRSSGLALIATGLVLAVFSSAAASPATPESLGNPGLWLSAAELKKTLQESQPVTRWPDKSGHGYDAVFEPRIPQAGTMGVGEHQPPLFKTDKEKGFPIVSFTAERRQTLILNRAGHALGQGVSGFTAVFVIRPSFKYAPSAGLFGTETRYLFISHLSDYNTRISVQVVRDTGEVRLNSRAVPGAAMERMSSTAEGSSLVLRENAWQRLIVTVDCQAKVARIVIDGAVVSRPLSPGSAAAFEAVPSPITGVASTTFSGWMNCQLAELICYERALGLEEIRNLDASLREKYGLPVDSPVSSAH